MHSLRLWNLLLHPKTRVKTPGKNIGQSVLSDVQQRQLGNGKCTLTPVLLQHHPITLLPDHTLVDIPLANLCTRPRRIGRNHLSTPVGPLEDDEALFGIKPATGAVG